MDSPVVVSSSIPSVPWTTKARLAPSITSVRPTSKTRLGASTPITWRTRVGRVGERTDQVEDCPEAECAAKRAQSLHGRVIERREEKDEACFAETFDGEFRRKLDGNAESFKHIGCAAARSDGAVAVLGDACSGG